MDKYKVYFYFNVYQFNPFLTPNKTVEVEVQKELSENDIILEALKTLESYPRTYTAKVIKIS